MKHLLTLLLIALPLVQTSGQEKTELTPAEAKTLYKDVSKKRVDVHDPSVVWDHQQQRYYIVGSHKAGAYSKDLQNWTKLAPTWQVGTNTNASNADAFTTPAVKTVMKGGAQVAFPQFNAMDWAGRSDASYNINGNMWAPDLIWNPTMQKWCMYLSINGDSWHSSIILLTADKANGPFTYQGPIVISGFKDAEHSFKDTDLELALGQTLTALPARYNVGNSWGNRWPNNIDPAVFYDEEGKLWLIYGSWSGGIWMLELDETTGLRDYDVTYPVTGSGNAATSDPYFGKKIAGGYYVSGEGPYIEHIGNYYYLFMSYGFFAPGGLDEAGKPSGGYEMRVFRSERPDGPYVDSRNRSAVYDKYVLNYGCYYDNNNQVTSTATDQRGEKLFGAYNNWGMMTVGECAQGHNSVIAADDGRTYLVCHTKFNNGTAGHQVRVHQLFVNKDGWLVASPFEYNGETTTDADIASQATIATDDIPGTYQLLLHKYGMDYAHFEEVTPVQVTLTADGKVTGGKTGTWTKEEGDNGYFNIKIGANTYKGVIYEEVMDQRSLHLIAFTCANAYGVNVWGYKVHPKYELAMQLNGQTVPVKEGQNVQRDYDLYGMSLGLDNTTLTWKSSVPDIISDYGKYNPTGLTEDVPVTLSARIETGNYFWAQDYNVKALAFSLPTADWQTGLLAHYGFDSESLANSFDASQCAELKHLGTTKLPTLGNDEPLRTGRYVQTCVAALDKESYVEMPNPLYGQELSEGATIAFWVKPNTSTPYGTLFGLQNGDARLYFTNNLYTGFNDGAGKWLDVNHPNQVSNTDLKAGQWTFVTIIFSRKATDGVKVYLGRTQHTGDRYKGEIDGKSITTKSGFDYNYIVDHLAASPTLCLGKGSFWGSPDARLDDIFVYNRPLSATQLNALELMANRVFDFSSLTSGIEVVSTAPSADSHYFDLQGRRVEGTPQRPGLYIKQGRKIFVK